MTRRLFLNNWLFLCCFRLVLLSEGESLWLSSRGVSDWACGWGDTYVCIIPLVRDESLDENIANGLIEKESRILS